MKIQKGDLVQMLPGKDRGKQGRVVDAQPRCGARARREPERRAAAQKPQPIRDASRMGGTQMTPGGIIEKPIAVPVGNVMIVCPTCKLPTRIGLPHQRGQGGETLKVRVCKRAGCGQEID